MIIYLFIFFAFLHLTIDRGRRSLVHYTSRCVLHTYSIRCCYINVYIEANIVRYRALESVTRASARARLYTLYTAANTRGERTFIQASFFFFVRYRVRIITHVLRKIFFYSHRNLPAK